MTWNRQKGDWPDFTCDADALNGLEETFHPPRVQNALLVSVGRSARIPREPGTMDIRETAQAKQP